MDAMFALTRRLAARSVLVSAAVFSMLLLRPAALPAAGDTVPPAPADNPVMVSISAPTQVPPKDTASVGTASLGGPSSRLGGGGETCAGNLDQYTVISTPRSTPSAARP